MGKKNLPNPKTLEQAIIERNNWCDTAAQHLRNEEYYRGLVIKIGEMFGAPAYISDDSSVHQDVICAKVPDLVASLIHSRPSIEWDSFFNRYYEPVEQRAKEIYNILPYDGHGEKPAWVPHGNSLKQDEARNQARAELRAIGHKAKMTDAKITINGKNLTESQTNTLIAALRSFSFQLQNGKFLDAYGSTAIIHRINLYEIISLIDEVPKA